MFDTHAHVHDAAFDADRAEMLERARVAGIARIATVGTDVADSLRAQAIAREYELDYTVGIHPHEAKDAPADIAAAFDAMLAGIERPPLAIGEMGLDYYYRHSSPDAQRDVLVAQLRYARERSLPAVFHQRDAYEDFVDVLRREIPEGIDGVVHCFTGDAEQARRLVDEFGLRLGIGGVLTFKTAQPLRDAVRAVGLGALILETDCPYLAPVPYRGKRNEPAFMAATASLLGELFDTSLEDVAARTNATAQTLFGESMRGIPSQA